MPLRELVWSNVPRARRVRRRGQFLEVLLVVAIVGVLLIAFARVMPPLMIKLRVLDATSLLATQRADTTAYWATTGRFPSEASPERTTRNLAAPYWQDAELVYPATGELLRRLSEVAALEPGVAAAVSFRLATASSGSTVWLCGGSDAPEGFSAAPAQHTTIPAQYLPHFCRSATLAP